MNNVSPTKNHSRSWWAFLDLRSIVSLLACDCRLRPGSVLWTTVDRRILAQHSWHSHELPGSR